MSPVEYGISDLKKTYDLTSFAKLIGVKPSALSYVLYKFSDAQKYTSKPIPKKSGGTRTVYIPHPVLKTIQKKTAKLLVNCEKDVAADIGIKKSVSHAFKQDHSILTNASVHRGANYVFNIDLESFFDAINFGRIYGYLTKNKYYQLNENVAKIIAHMACYNAVLVQGSPLSPVISNMVGNIIDSRMITLCKKHSCLYSRYADDITISSRFKKFPERLAFEIRIENSVGNGDNADWLPGLELQDLISRAGFRINSSKTRMHFKQSRQSVTSLTVNRRINVERVKFKRIRAQVNEFTRKGTFVCKVRGVGETKRLRGALDFCFWVKKNNGYFNEDNSNFFIKDGEKEKTNLPRTSFEWLFYKFLFSKLFIHNEAPTIMFEGETDYIYFREARKSKTTKSLIKNKVHFQPHTGTIRDILRIKGGSAQYAPFVASYEKTRKAYSKVKPNNIVVLVFDNDDGLNSMLDNIKKFAGFDKPTAKLQSFIHLVGNLYIVLTPIGKPFPKNDSYIEHLFEKSVLKTLIKGKKFDPNLKNNKGTQTFGKGVFAREVISPNRKVINFANFDIIFDRIESAQKHYTSNIFPNL